MKALTKKEIAERQIRLQKEIQNAGYNIVTCGNCGSILLHELGDDKIDCFCGAEMDLSDCPDYWYEGVELSEEFGEKIIKNIVMKNQKSVFEFGDEFICTEFYDVDLNCGGVEVKRNDEHLGSILGLEIPDIDDEEENEKFDQEVIDWIIDNNF